MLLAGFSKQRVPPRPGESRGWLGGGVSHKPNTLGLGGPQRCRGDPYGRRRWSGRQRPLDFIQ